MNGTPEAAIQIAAVTRKIQPKNVTSPYNVKEYSMEETMEKMEKKYGAHSTYHIFEEENIDCEEEQEN